MHLSPKSSPDSPGSWPPSPLTFRPHLQAIPAPGGRGKETGCPNRTWAGTATAPLERVQGLPRRVPGHPSEEHKS